MAGQSAAYYQHLAGRAAQKYGLDPTVFKALVKQESGFNPNARSSAGAIGLGQFMPATAAGLGVNPNDPLQNLDGAAKYLAQNLKRTGGDIKAALSIYNSGRPDAYKDPSFAGGQTYNYVRSILANAGSEGASVGSSASPQVSSSKTVTTPGVDNSQARASAISTFLKTNQDPVQFALAVRGLKDTPGTSTTTTSPGPSPAGSGGSDTAALVSRANAIDAKHLPYQWGGGHAGKVDAYNATPLDCSGAVSAVLGIDPKVSGQFETWGKPGDSGNKGTTIYANSTHVLMKVAGKFFATSSTNPGGGAGWVPAKNFSPEYLSKFTARHL